MRINDLQFAVVREDPRLDIEVLEAHASRRALLVASGGCTALAIANALPQVHCTLVDPNPAQLAHVEAKASALESLTGKALAQAFNVGTCDPHGLSERGNFEALFRLLRGFVHDLVLPRDAWLSHFEDGTPGELVPIVRSSRYWPVAFELAFHDALLHAMFGPAATQHAAPGSYPVYFQAAIERGLERRDVGDNPFLHHIFLGHYLEHAPPEFLRGRDAQPRRPTFEYLEAGIEAVNVSSYDFVGLSNILDWMAPDAVAALLARLGEQLRPGAVVMWRQLNNERPLHEQLRGRFTFDDHKGESLRAQDRSLFYGRIHVGVRNPGP